MFVLNGTYSFHAPCSPLFARSCTSVHGPLYIILRSTNILKTSTEMLSIVLHTSSRNTQSCLVCYLKGKTLLLLSCKLKNDQILYALSLTIPLPPAPPHLPVFSWLFLSGIHLCTNFTATSLRRPTATIRVGYPEFSRH